MTFICFHSFIRHFQLKKNLGKKIPYFFAKTPAVLALRTDELIKFVQSVLTKASNVVLITSQQEDEN